MNKDKNKEKSIVISYGTSINDPKLSYLIKAFGEEEVKAILVPDQIRLELAFNKPKELHVIFQLIKGFIYSLITKHPTKVHRDIVITALEENKIQYDDSIVDIISRELIAKCRILHLKLKTPSNLQDLTDNDKEDIETFSKESSKQALSLKIKRYTPSPELESAFEDGGIFIWDKAFVETIKETGKYGKQLSGNTESFQKIVKKHQEKQSVSLVHWFNFNSPSQEKPFYIAKTLQTLVVCIYKDTVERKVNFAAENPAGTTDKVTHALTKIFEPGKTTRKTEEIIQLHDKEHKLIAHINTATVDASIIERLVSEGINELETITAVRLVRFIIEAIYFGFTNNHDHWFDLKFPGGVKQIVKDMGLKNRRDVTKIKKLIHLLDTLKFDLPGIRSRLISIAECKPGSKYSPQGGLIITVQPPLRPYNVFNRDDKTTFIIPLLKEPPLVGHSKFHARQYILQFKITEWFSNKSKKLATNGWIHIPPATWNEWFYSLQIPNGKEELHKKIIKAITGDNGYLKPFGQDAYTLKNEPRALKFLTDQGKIRIRASIAGTASSQKKKPQQKRLGKRNSLIQSHLS